MAEVINGGDLMLFVDEQSIAFATSHKLTINRETVETTSKDSGGKWITKAARKISWSMSTENLYSNNGEGLKFDDLFDKLLKGDKINVVFGLEANYANKVDKAPTDGWVAPTSGMIKGEVLITSLEGHV